MVKIDVTQLTDWDMLLASILVSEIYGNVVETDWMISVFSSTQKNEMTKNNKFKKLHLTTFFHNLGHLTYYYSEFHRYRSLLASRIFLSQFWPL